jgi:DNA polymerase elongation subunit (family B)
MSGQDADLWWILDAYPDRRTNKMVLWLTGPRGARRLCFDYLPEFYIQAGERDLERAKRYFATGRLYESGMTQRRLALGSDGLTPVLRVTPRKLGLHLRAARAADFFGGYGRFRFYNLDIDLAQRFLAEQGLFPLARVRYPRGHGSEKDSGCSVQGAGSNGWCDLVDNRLSIHYLLPRLKVAELAVSVRKRGLLPSNEDALVSASLCGDEFTGPEEDILGGLVAALRRRDPDVILTDGGDTFVLPYLYHRARLAGFEGFHLGREGQSGAPNRKEKSHFSYGRILYRPAAYYLRGRLHIDRSSSFLYQEGDLEGILELSRLSGIAFQRMARSSPGTAISAMEVNLVLREGGLVAWKKNLPEDFKSMRCLLSTDRGGFIYEPRVGVHEQVLEVDFASMYPHIMVIHNISPETVNCSCCKPHEKERDVGDVRDVGDAWDVRDCAIGERETVSPATLTSLSPTAKNVPYVPSVPSSSPTARLVPGIGYWTCEKRLGLIPKILEPLVRRRMELKKLKKRPGDRWDRRSRVLKPLLVTCFGYTGYKNAPFGRIECHEAINAHGREILLESARIAERRGFEVVHGIVDSMWLKGPLEKRRELIAEIARSSGIPLSEEGVYKWLVFLPNKGTGAGALNRYFGLFENDDFKLRGIALRKHDTPGLVRGLEAGMLEVFSRARDAAGFMERIPDSIDVLRRFAGRVLDGECSPEELILTKRVSRSVEEYVQFNDTFCALKQLREEGLKVPPGDTVRYVVTDSTARDPRRRTVPVQLLDGVSGQRAAGNREGSGSGQRATGSATAPCCLLPDPSPLPSPRCPLPFTYDKGVYYKMLLRAAEEMLSPFGYDMERLDKVLKGMDTAQAELEWPLRARGIEGRGPLHAA